MKENSMDGPFIIESTLAGGKGHKSHSEHIPEQGSERF